jgi:hypothetical protein
MREDDFVPPNGACAALARSPCGSLRGRDARLAARGTRPARRACNRTERGVLTGLRRENSDVACRSRRSLRAMWTPAEATRTPIAPPHPTGGWPRAGLAPSSRRPSTHVREPRRARARTAWLSLGRRRACGARGGQRRTPDWPTHAPCRHLRPVPLLAPRPRFWAGRERSDAGQRQSWRTACHCVERPCRLAAHRRCCGAIFMTLLGRQAAMRRLKRLLERLRWPVPALA